MRPGRGSVRSCSDCRWRSWPASGSSTPTPGLRPPRSLLAAIRAGEAGGVIFFGPEHRERRPAPRRDQRAPASEPGEPGPRPAADAHRPGGRRGPPASRAPRCCSEKQIGESAERRLARRGGGRRRRPEPAGRRDRTSTSRRCSTSTGSPETSSTSSSAPTRATPRLGAQLGAAFMAAQQHAGVAATAKHFPGLGAASRSQNTDLGPVTLRCRCRRCAPSTRRHTERDRGRREARDDLVGGLSGARSAAPGRAVAGGHPGRAARAAAASPA